MYLLIFGLFSQYFFYQKLFRNILIENQENINDDDDSQIENEYSTERNQSDVEELMDSQ